MIGHIEDVAEQFEGVQAQKNRITRSLRTQQCAWNACSLLLEVPRPANGTVLTSACMRADQIVDVPLVSWSAEERMSSKQNHGRRGTVAGCQVAP